MTNMATVQTSNYLPHIQHLLDVQGDDGAVALEVTCACCHESKLDISRVARYASFDEPVPECFDETHEYLPRYQKRGIERTVAFPCGHVLGDRCVAHMFMTESQCATCPSCGYKMQYAPCGHLIAPALVPVRGHEPVRDRFPLTLPEGAGAPVACKECRWRAVVSKLQFALAADCALCRQRREARMPFHDDGGGEAEHEVHRAQYLASGVRDALSDVMQLVWPDFVTRETAAAAERAVADADRRQATLSVLVAMVLSELEKTIWYRTPAKTLSAASAGRHHATVNFIEQNLLGWLMEFRDDSRRAW